MKQYMQNAWYMYTTITEFSPSSRFNDSHLKERGRCVGDFYIKSHN